MFLDSLNPLAWILLKFPKYTGNKQYDWTDSEVSRSVQYPFLGNLLNSQRVLFRKVGIARKQLPRRTLKLPADWSTNESSWAELMLSKELSNKLA